jgi:hypothetical protein
MKSKVLLLSVVGLSALSLVSCGESSSVAAVSSQGTSSEQSSAVKVEEKTFQDQLKNAGLTLEYVDPNSDFTHTEGNRTDGYPDATTGGSNKPLYTLASISSYEELLYRSNLSFKHYYWSEVKDSSAASGASTSSAAESIAFAKDLTWAVKLPDAKYVTELFPNDGKYYEIKVDKSAIGTKALVTASADGTPNVAVFGAGLAKDETTNKYYINASYLTAGITTTNLLNTGKGEMLYYEYNYDKTGNANKMGPGLRNYGCRVDFTVDLAYTYTMGLDYKKTKVDALGSAPAVSSYAALVTRLVFTNLKTLG